MQSLMTSRAPDAHTSLQLSTLSHPWEQPANRQPRVLNQSHLPESDPLEPLVRSKQRKAKHY
jgi:hypothetical protein